MPTQTPILIVEDDADTRATQQRLLELAGYAVICAANGQEALELLRGGLRPAAILLDMGMPIMNGRRFRLRQRRDPSLAAIPLVLLSGSSNLEEDAASLAADAWFHKPVDVGQLLMTLRSLVGDNHRDAADYLQHGSPTDRRYEPVMPLH
jgi:CheY-like chemotaxis protein